MGSEGRTAVVVVTHNRPDLLRRCVLEVLDQHPAPGKILVVDNASSRPAADVLGGMPVDVMRLDENVGGAGGFKAGVQALLADTEGRWDYLWLMDDDSTPGSPDCLALLCGVLKKDPSLWSCAPAVDHEGGHLIYGHVIRKGTRRRRGLSPVFEVEGSPRWPEIDAAPFVGLLIRADIARIIGPIRDDFFIWFDDIEYCLRAKSAGYHMRAVPAARMLHPSAASRTRTIGGLALQAGVVSPGREYYSARNSILVRRLYARSIPDLFPGMPWRAIRELRHWLAVVATDRPNAVARLVSRLRGLVDGHLRSVRRERR